jgi:copper chaperone
MTPTEETTMDEITLTVPGMTCAHCTAAVASEVGRVRGVDRVDVDLDTKLVTVSGVDVDRAEVIAAIDEAGYEADEARSEVAAAADEAVAVAAAADEAVATVDRPEIALG